MRCISYHIYSSIWSSIKSEMVNIDANCRWLIGNGENINFWLDPWCGEPFASVLNIPTQAHQNLSARVSDFIVESNWSFPSAVDDVFPILKQMALQVTLPFADRDDSML